jgi:WD40 repeat protein
MQQRMGGINGIQLSKDLSCTISVGQDRKLVFWDNDLQSTSGLSKTTNMFVQKHLDGENDEGLAVATSHSGKFVATGGTAGVVRIWSYPSGVFVVEGRGHNAVIQALAFSPDDKQLISGAIDGGIIIWYLALSSGPQDAVMVGSSLN